MALYLLMSIQTLRSLFQERSEGADNQFQPWADYKAGGQEEEFAPKIEVAAPKTQRRGGRQERGMAGTDQMDIR